MMYNNILIYLGGIWQLTYAAGTNNNWNSTATAIVVAISVGVANWVCFHLISRIELMLFGQDNYYLYQWIRLDESHKALRYNETLRQGEIYATKNSWKNGEYLDMRLVGSSNRYQHKSNITNNYVDDGKISRANEKGISLTTVSAKSLWGKDSKKKDRLQASLLATETNQEGENIISI